ncbi:MAG TPA: type II secretion system protein GspM [Casimicrobiaceae bacterium]|jgi:general secretion pathway protein M|nr:type II secretion system protein GspM [Casimicrobiaceae bacterium]
MTPAWLARLAPPQARALALGLLVVALVLVLGLLLAPVLLLHKHYDDAIETWSTRLGTYRRVAAQAPALRSALDAMRSKDGRRFYLRNTAPNLAGAELQELVKAAIEGQGGRITTSQSPAPRDDAGFRQIVANVQFFATTPNLQRILLALETREPYLVVDNITIRPTNAFRGFKPAAGQEPEVNVQLDVSAWAMPEPAARPAAAPARPPA